MAHSYKFAVIQLAPDPIRGERLNIGLAIFREANIEFRMTKKLDRVRAISGSLDIEMLHSLVGRLKAADTALLARGIKEIEQRYLAVSKIGPLEMSNLGTFLADTPDDYERRVNSTLQMLVEPEPGRIKKLVKKSRLVSDLRKSLRRERVLASHGEGLESHRVVSNYEVAEGLVADLVLKNGSYHVIETVDASGDEGAIRKTIADIAVSALVLESARMKFQELNTSAKLVYSASSTLERVARPSLEAAEHQGTLLVNWESTDDRNKFIHAIASMATPLEPKNKGRFVKSGTLGFYH